MCTWSMLSFQNANSPSMLYMIKFHDFAMLIIMTILNMIFYIMFSLTMNKTNNKYIQHNHLIEIIWTLVPMFILIFMAIPSLKILYLSDELIYPLMTIKSIGHQWYWSYEYSDFINIEFDSYMMLYDSNNTNMFRLLDVDNRLIIPMNSNIRMMISSTDVIHSWTVPSMGIKMDAIPGRINQTNMMALRPGLYFGQCSEICGMNHSFMPIVIESTSKSNFINWLNNLK